ncbi:MAG: hypothetical protein CMO26_14545, partial [Thiotrichales bacterium]|nr:hypothetical protein [Thiotrichales bacterium]
MVLQAILCIIGQILDRCVSGSRFANYICAKHFRADGTFVSQALLTALVRSRDVDTIGGYVFLLTFAAGRVEPIST